VLKTTRPTVNKWIERYEKYGIEGRLLPTNGSPSWPAENTNARGSTGRTDTPGPGWATSESTDSKGRFATRLRMPDGERCRRAVCGRTACTVCAVRRFVVSPVQPGGTRREVLGSPDLPGGESPRGTEHVREAVAVWRCPGWCAARPAR
jgi:hypothetical protein